MQKSKTRTVRAKVRNPDGSGFLVFTIENTGNLDLERLGEKLTDTYKRALEENRLGACYEPGAPFVNVVPEHLNPRNGNG